MVLYIGDRSLKRVSIVDDDEMVRQGYEYPVEELGLIPSPEVGPLPPVDGLVQALLTRTDAAICDHHLSVKNYANYNGAELVARCYQARLPALLCTKWEDASIDEIRLFRQHIPVLLKPSELDPDSIRAGFTHCCEEFVGVFRPTRKPWRTLVRVEDISPDRLHRFLYVVVSGWSPNEVIRLRLEDIPTEILREPFAGLRLHAQVNIGAEHASELYFAGWESQ